MGTASRTKGEVLKRQTQWLVGLVALTWSLAHYGAAQRRHRCCVAQGIEQAQPHAPPAIGLHAGDVGDGGNMVVIEPVTKPEDRSRDKGELKAIEGRGHGHLPVILICNSSLFHTPR